MMAARTDPEGSGEGDDGRRANNIRPAAADRHRTRFREELIRLEDQVIGGLDLVVSQLDRAIEAINYQDIELAAIVAADDRQIDGRYIEVHQGVLSLLGRQALFAR